MRWLPSKVCMREYYVAAISISLLVASCAATAQSPIDDHTIEDRLRNFSRQTHHWGLRGEASPHNGWSDYSRLQLDFSVAGGDKVTFRQGSNEFSVTARNGDTADIVLRIVSIPGAGIFIASPSPTNCAPDQIERMGLYAELALYFLSLAYPSGPLGADAPRRGTSVEIEAGPVTLRFMQGVVQLKRQSTHTIRVEAATPDYLGFVAHDEDGIAEFRVLWKKEESASLIVSDSESLDGWTACWSGPISTETGAGAIKQSHAINTEAIKTFGDIRRLVKATQ